MLPDFFQFHTPTRILYRPGLSGDCSTELQQLKLTKPLIVTDIGVQKAGLLEPLLQSLAQAGIEPAGIFNEVPPNSSLEVVQKVAQIGRDLKVDGLIAVGGGSVMDTAKAANILISHGGDLVADYSGVNTLPGPCKPLVTIPTTAGTGSEVTGAAVILDSGSHTKLTFTDRNLYATLTVLDPELTSGLPPLLTAATGMDALTHAIEALYSLQANPFSEAYALRAIPLIREFLPRATRDGKDREARAGMLVAATLAGVAFDQAMVGVVHGMAHSLGALAPVHHGMANAVFLPWGMEYNLEGCEDIYTKMAPPLGMHIRGMNKPSAARTAIAGVRNLREELHKICKLPRTLRELDVSLLLARKIAQGATEDGTSFYNPRPVLADDLLPYVERSFDQI